MVAAVTPHVVRLEDHEGDGTCTHCQRTGLRWIAVLSDGRTIGTGCARKVLGYPISTSAAATSWLSQFRPVAERTAFGHTFVLWEQINGPQTRITDNSSLVQVGGARADWEAGRYS